MKMIDLSMPIYTGMQTYPGDPQVKISVVHTYEQESWELRKLELGSHTGTHVDAFSHMHEGHRTLDDIPLRRFCGEAQLVEREADWAQGIGLLFLEEVDESYLEKLLRTGPNFVGGNITERLERLLLKHDIVTYTNLVQLEKLPVATSFQFYGFPLKISSGDGSPVRAVAIL